MRAAIIVILLLLAPVALAAAATRTEVKTYGPLAFLSCSLELAAGRHDGQCFDLRPGDATLTVRVRDTTGLAIGWSWSQFAEDGQTVLAAGQECGDRTFNVVEGGARLLVRQANLPQNLVFYCGALGNGVPGQPTQGTTQVTFLG